MACAQRSASVKTTLRGTFVSSESIVETLIRQPPCARYESPRAPPAVATYRQTVTTRLHSRDGSCSPFLAGCGQRRTFCRSECGRSALRIARIGTMNASTGADEAREYHDPP